MIESTKRLENLVKELYKCHSLHDAEKALVLFDVGISFVVIGADADKLYLTLGWEITDFSDGDTIYSYIVISPYGAKILQDQRFNIETHKVEQNYQISGQSTATVQQALDYLRLLIGQERLNYPIITPPITIEGVGFIREARITSLIINAHSIEVCIDNTELIEVVKDHEWNFSRTGLSLIGNLSNLIEQQVSYMASLIQAHAQTLRNQRTLNTALYEQYLNKRREVSPNTIVIIPVKDFYLAFDDDAIDVSCVQKGVLLYECNVFGLRGRTVALLDDRQVKKIRSTHQLIVVGIQKHSPLYELGLKESFLNIKCNYELTYTDVVIRKQKDGEYVISASYCGHPLPETPILNTIGGYYCNLPSCKERSAILSSLAHRTYDSLILSVFDSSE